MWCRYAFLLFIISMSISNASCNLIAILGFSITPEQLVIRVKDYIASSSATGWANLGPTLGALKTSDLRWANPLELKSAVENAFTDRFGPKEAAKPKGKVDRYMSTLCDIAVKLIIIYHASPSRKLKRMPLPQLRANRYQPHLHPSLSFRRGS